MTAMEKRLYEYPAGAGNVTEEMSENLRFAAAVAEAGMLLRETKDLSSAHVQSFEPGHAASHGDPVSRTATRRADLERMIVRLARRVFPITRMLVDLEAGGEPMRQMADILKMRYFQRKSWGEIGRILHIPERTLRRRKRELLEIVKKYLL